MYWQGVKLSAEFRGFSWFYGHLWDQCNLIWGELWKAIWGGGTSTTTWPTEMVHLSKFAEMCGNPFKTVSLWQILANPLENISFIHRSLDPRLPPTCFFSLNHEYAFHSMKFDNVASFRGLRVLYNLQTEETQEWRKEETNEIVSVSPSRRYWEGKSEEIQTVRSG